MEVVADIRNVIPDKAARNEGLLPWVKNLSHGGVECQANKLNKEAGIRVGHA